MLVAYIRRVRNEDGEDFMYGLAVLVFTVVVTTGVYLFSWDEFLVLWLLGCFVINYLLGQFIYSLHKSASTERDIYFYLKSLGNFFELMVYSLLVTFQLYALLAGALVIKAVGSIGTSDKDKVKIVAIYRLGFILQLMASFILGYIFFKSDGYEAIKNLGFIPKY